jgi:hypothetical protein
MATHLIDCPACACLIDPAEPACPFCGATQRRMMMPAALTLGLALGLASVSCNDKPDTTTMSTMSTTATTEATAATDTEATAATVDDDSTTMGPVAAYAAPPETDSDSVSASSPTETPSTGDTTGDATTNGDDSTGINSVSAYAGAPGGADPLDPPDDLVGR